MHLNTDTEGASIELSESPVKGDAKRKKGVTGGAGLGALSKLGKRSRETGMQVAHNPKNFSQKVQFST